MPKRFPCWVLALVLTQACARGLAAPTESVAGPRTTTPAATRIPATPVALLTASPTLAPTLTPFPLAVPNGPRGRWLLLFSDEFEGDSLDVGRWTTCYWWDNGGCTNRGNQELQWYLPGNLVVSDGTLKLRAVRSPVTASDGQTYPYASGMVTSGRSTSDTSRSPRFTFQYGFAEIRARLPRGQGLWPAFWLLPASHDSTPEVDVMEVLGHEPDRAHFTVHFNTDNGKRQAGEEWTGPDFSAAWHTFGVDWGPQALVWYVDGLERWRYTDAARIPAEPMYLLANLAVGGDWPGAPDASTPFPSDYEIDYVRVWSREPQAFAPALADVTVTAEWPAGNFSGDHTLVVDADPARLTYLKFDLAAFAGQRLIAAVLRLKTTTDSSAGSSSRQRVLLAPDVNWEANTLTFDQRPPMVAAELGSLSQTRANTTYDIPLDAALLQAHLGVGITLIIDSAGDDGLYFYSTESGPYRPQLNLSVEQP